MQLKESQEGTGRNRNLSRIAFVLSQLARFWAATGGSATE